MKNVPCRAAAAILACVSTVVCTPSLFAWGETGHQIVATVAARGLSPKAAKQVNVLLGGKSLADVAPLPDQLLLAGLRLRWVIESALGGSK